MNYIVSASTDIGIKKDTNQDSLSVKVFNTPTGKMAFVILCDGMGGLAKGEVASAAVIEAFSNWAMSALPCLSVSMIEKNVIIEQWNSIVQNMNNHIKDYGYRCGVSLGTTCAVLLLTDYGYFAMNVGDSRIYEITDTLKLITKDQTLVAREVELGNLTPEQAELDPRRSVLLQCIGASDIVVPDFFFGENIANAVYMLCSDGFRHVISPDEIFSYLNPTQLVNEEVMQNNSQALIETNKQRYENDNISVVTVRTF